MKIIKCLKSIQEHQPELESIQANLKATNKKTTALKKKSEDAKPTIKKILTILPLLWAIHITYEQQEEKGIKAYRKAAVSTISKKQTTSMLQNYVKGLFQ